MLGVSSNLQVPAEIETLGIRVKSILTGKDWETLPEPQLVLSQLLIPILERSRPCFRAQNPSQTGRLYPSPFWAVDYQRLTSGEGGSAQMPKGDDDDK